MSRSTNLLAVASQTDTNGLRDIRPPVEIPSGWEWLWWTLGILALLAVIALIVWWVLRRRANRPPPPEIPPHVRALQRLQQALSLMARPEPFVVEVSSAVRGYLEERFSFHAPERTTEEFLHELQGTKLLSADQQETLAGFLEQSDLVKFARYEPGEPELQQLHNAAVRLIEETAPTPEFGPEPVASTPPPLNAE